MSVEPTGGSPASSPSAAHRRLRWLDRTVIALTVIGCALLLVPMQQDVGLQRLFNLAHVPGFALLAWLWAEDLLARGWTTGRRALATALGGAILAAATEWLQSFAPGRHADLADLLRNALGLILGLGLHVVRPGLLASRAPRAR